MLFINFLKHCFECTVNGSLQMVVCIKLKSNKDGTHQICNNYFKIYFINSNRLLKVREKLNMSAEESDESDSDNDNNCNYVEDADNVEHEFEDDLDQLDQDWTCPVSNDDEPSSESSDEEDIQETILGMY